MSSSAELRSNHKSGNAKKGSHDLLGCKDCKFRECQKDNSHELLSMLETELNILSSENVDILKLCGENQFIEEFYSQTYSVDDDDAAKLKQQRKGDTAYSYNDIPPHMLDVIDHSPKKSGKTDTKGFMDFDYYCPLDPGHTKKPCSELDSEWIGVEKAEPWWRTADKDLAASGSLKSSGYVGNSDPSLPHQYLGGESYNFSQCSSQVQIADKEVLVTSKCNGGRVPSPSQYKRLCTSGAKGCSPIGLTQALSDDDEDSRTAKVLSAKTQPGSNDLSKGQLLEALCHSQTRAREAERMAQQAYNEKEHVIKIFFKQASYLFAYRQWLQIMQLEALCRQLRNKAEQNSTNISAKIPSVQCKGRPLRKRRYRPIKRKPGKGQHKIRKSVVAFAFGLSLAGAGLILGWTMGWLFPAF